MIKSIRIKPVTMTADNTTVATIVAEFNAQDLYNMYVKLGIDPSNVTVSYVTVTDGEYDTVPINLAEAFNTGHEVSSYAVMEISY